MSATSQLCVGEVASLLSQNLCCLAFDGGQSTFLFWADCKDLMSISKSVQTLYQLSYHCYILVVSRTHPFQLPRAGQHTGAALLSVFFV